MGMLFDDYELLTRIGRGGMGEVWQAKDIPGKREVAIKFVPKEIAGAEEEMVRVEAMFAQVHGLQHEHICPLYAMKSTPGFGTYIVMKYVPGMTLGKFVREACQPSWSFPAATLVQILAPIASALDYAHRKSVIHRDIKPENIMVLGDPKTLEITDVQLIDFGLAATFRASLSRISHQSMGASGTYSYMAPEQWNGQKQDASTDQYALAVTAYEILAGGLPFVAEDSGVLHILVKNQAPPPIPDQPSVVNAAIKRALSKERKSRFPSCQEFVDALKGRKTFIQPPTKRNLSATKRSGAPSHSFRYRILGITCLLLVLAAFWGFWKWNAGNRVEVSGEGISGNDISVVASAAVMPSEIATGNAADKSTAGIAARLGVSKGGTAAAPARDITDAELAHLRDWPLLQILDLTDCDWITDKGLQYLKWLTSLQTLRLDDCALVTTPGIFELKDALPQCRIFAPLPHPRAVERLGISSDGTEANPVKDATDAELAYLSGLTQLESINLNDCMQITDAGLAHLKGLAWLRSLNLKGCPNITTIGLMDLQDKLVECKVSGQGDLMK